MKFDREMLRQLEIRLQSIRARAANIVTRAVVRLVNDGLKLQRVQLAGNLDEIIDGDGAGGEHFQPYGFTSVPLDGSEAVVVFPNGDHGHPLVIAVSDRRHRPTAAEPGEVTVYNDKGAKVTLLTSGDIEVEPGHGGKVRIGGAGADTPPALSSELADLKSRIASWAPVPNDGGASLKPVFAAWPVPGATKVDVE